MPWSSPGAFSSFLVKNSIRNPLENVPELSFEACFQEKLFIFKKIQTFLYENLKFIKKNKTFQYKQPNFIKKKVFF